MRTILHVETEDDKTYNVSCDEGTTVTEMVFAMAVAARTLQRDGYYDSPIAIEALFHKYLTGDEFSEQTEEETNVSDTTATE